MAKANPADSEILITPVILAGGSGTRLWPLSRKSYPKQFVPLLGAGTLFQDAARRLSGATDAFRFARPMVLTNSLFRFIIAEQLAQEGIDPEAILIEPEGRNTAPAILAAALHLASKQPDAVLLVAPSDHVITDAAAFREAVGKGLAATAKGDLVTFGIQPTRPETGYGYLEIADRPDGSGQPIKLASFVEKPNAQRAAEMLATGNYLWNAGIFLFAARDIIAAFQRHAPTMFASVQQAVEQAESDLGFLRLAEEPWSRADNLAIDYAIMERADNLSVVPYDAGWSDLGDWDSVWSHMQPDADGVALSGAATALDCRNVLLRSETEGLEIVGLGLDNIVAVAMNDAVLIADKSRTQDVKKVVEALQRKGAVQAETFPKDHRPWGWYESLLVGGRFQVKRITVLPGASLSLQSHFHRSEHWIVVEGTARVTLDAEVSLLTENQSIYIPVGAQHRIENPGRIPMVFIEVQTGPYVGEDDIVRYEDRYARG
ncbi:mannose-1-phosphate guanylyltransferase/mannose-6-phosphate isomerase [Sphingobium yanoikuyae]|jgi:mannose-1-phosphate guanylyltransferase/mannose-6-phosphate isomerase|uniref:mannose-1-phosphate guanylyltransferase n=1 Tax=Sphingobium yanoikuyae TaxID=13690 RepID=A0AA42WV24_SPHYA|nr:MULTISPECIES: mannose-1-phosphate guanylyltransferase/mannose-6-phosphate isomerase [Sphingobium]MDH2131081.1 mannose-1-phosphate guanylyltransferase/mannose-6-phosphate isomerase [Sphingobium yanoikuyae]MDH2149179.1 mannose-1-phosphate guanylyltransferase/mannose-6-phosphate isomerase [Sphingobium yanoikuyae]MDH2166964.1 mannose-1-phosphate guanylyltransferase/mannose-6-phosphate isomerase [Sphingobium yanoikuyae]PHP17210.1 mannose-1-phosphate guanylyltransferase/mannose-6-phosphate isomera